MDSFQYAQSVQERAQSAYGDTLTEYNQERQIATAHFENEKKELVNPLSFIGGGMASSAAGSLGKKIAAKSGIKAFEKLGQESISTTMKNAAKEALEMGKTALTGKINGTIQNAISKDGGRDLINKTLKENGYAELTDEDFANPSTLGDKILKQSVSKAKAKLPDLPDPEDIKPPDTVAVDDLKVPSGTTSTLKDIDLTPSDVDTLKDILGRYVGEDYKSKTFELGDSVGRSGAEQAGTGLRGDSILARTLGESNLQPSHLTQLGNDDLPNQQRVQAEMDQQDNSLGRDISDQDTKVNGQPKAPEPEDQDAIRPASPKPSGDPVPDPVDADAAKAGEEGAEEGTNILSKLTDIVGASDVATGGLDIGGDILEAGLGIAGLFLPGLLDTQKKAPTAPVNNFVGNYSAGTGIV